MTQELKEIFDKPQSEWNEDEKKAVEEAIQAFKDEITEVCKKHEMTYQAILSVTEKGIVPTMNILKVSFEEKK